MPTNNLSNLQVAANNEAMRSASQEADHKVSPAGKAVRDVICNHPPAGSFDNLCEIIARTAIEAAGVEGLVKALEPFADFGDDEPEWSDSGMVACRHGASTFYLEWRDFRRARAALTATEANHESR